MPSFTNAPTLSQLLHDLAGPLSVLSMCLPELKKERSSRSKKKQLLALSLEAVGEARLKLKAAQSAVEVYENQIKVKK